MSRVALHAGTLRTVALASSMPDRMSLPNSASRRSALALLATSGVLVATACASRAPPSGANAAALAPTGRLRASINLGNPILARRDAAGSVEDVSVDLARALGAELGVPVDLAVVDAAVRSVEAVATGQADLGFSRSIRCAARASASARRTC
jgi:polar amino acid transport system substrate-binding protein